MGSKKIGKYFRINSSRSGVSVSGGISGFRVSLGSKGLRTHVTVPGTGYTKTNTLFSFKKLWNKKKKEKKAANSGIKDQDQGEEVQADLLEANLPVGDELMLIMPRRRPFGSFTDKAKADREVNKAIEAYKVEDYGQAVEYLLASHRLYDQDIEVILYLAVITYMHLENYQEALKYFNLLPLQELNEDMKLAMADCMLEVEDYEGSIDLLDTFKFEDLEDMERMTLMARNHMELREYKAAEELLKEAMGRKRKLTPYLMEAKYWTGVLYVRRGDYESAKKYLMPVYKADRNYEEIAALIEEVAMNGKEAD